MNILDLGPLYGPVTQDGLPILGITYFKEIFTGEWEEEWPDNVLKPGVHDFTKLYIEEGQLMASGNMFDPPVTSAVWDYDDLQVIMSLVYGSNKGPQAPSFDLHASTDFTPETMQKIWTPFWLENTNYGKTMFCAYYWLRSFLLFPERFEVCKKDNSTDPEHYDMGWQVIDYLKAMKKQYQFNNTDKVILKPLSTHVDFKKEEQFLKLTDFEMTVEILRLNENNQYQVCEYSSEAFNVAFQRVFMSILPLFHRVHAITALYICVEYFRENGLAPDQKYIDMAKEEYSDYSTTM